MENDWRQLKIIRDFFQIRDDGQMPEGSRLLLEAAKPVRFEAGEDLMTEGAEPDDGMYIFLEGKAQVLIGTNLVNELSEGDVAGELALIKDGVRKATVRAATPVLCANIPRGLFEEIAEKNRKVYGALLELLYTKTTQMVTERERLRSELEVAARIQTGFLPKSFEEFQALPDVHITARMKPAKEVGGDFYDVFLIDDHRMCFLIADVSGKGVPAALFMTVAKAQIKTHMKLGIQVGRMAELVNDRLNDDNEESLFVTAFIAVLDTETGLLTYVNAGHNKPCISTAKGKFRFLDCKADFVLGAMEDLPYREQTAQLDAGSRICLYTDGVTEAFDKDGVMFGDDRLLETLNRHMDQADAPEELLDALYGELEHFAKGAPQSDDITVVYLAR